MATANVIPFPSIQARPQPVRVGDLYLGMAAQLVASMPGKPPAAVRIDGQGQVTLIDSECDFFRDAVTAPGFAGFCTEDSIPARIADRLREAHFEAIAWVYSVSGTSREA